MVLNLLILMCLSWLVMLFKNGFEIGDINLLMIFEWQSSCLAKLSNINLTKSIVFSWGKQEKLEEDGEWTTRQKKNLSWAKNKPLLNNELRGKWRHS